MEPVTQVKRGVVEPRPQQRHGQVAQRPEVLHPVRDALGRRLEHRLDLRLRPANPGRAPRRGQVSLDEEGQHHGGGEQRRPAHAVVPPGRPHQGLLLGGAATRGTPRRTARYSRATAGSGCRDCATARAHSASRSSARPRRGLRLLAGQPLPQRRDEVVVGQLVVPRPAPPVVARRRSVGVISRSSRVEDAEQVVEVRRAGRRSPTPPAARRGTACAP